MLITNGKSAPGDVEQNDSTQQSLRAVRLQQHCNSQASRPGPSTQPQQNQIKNMNSNTLLKTTALGLALVGSIATSSFADVPKLKAEDFHAKLRHDDTALPKAGQLLVSYADVVEKVLPAVVRVTTYGKQEQALGMGGGQHGRGGMGQLPPEMQEQLRRYFGLPPGTGNGNPFDQNEEEDSDPNDQPRGRSPQQQKKSTPRDQKLGTGSGVIISADGYIITNNHVVADSTKLEVTVGADSRSYPATIIGTDPNTDVALIKIERTGLTYATVGDSAKLRVGDVVFAAGSPMELSQSVSQGIVSALGRKGMGITGYENFIQTDASINHGNSGGPLFDALGRVVGINTAILSKSGMNGGIGFSIPMNMVLNVAEDLLDDGKVKRGFLGIGMEPVAERLARRWNLENDGGVSVNSVVPGQPAEKAGIEVGDVVISAAGQTVDNPATLKSIVGATKPGQPMLFEIVRDGQKKSLTVTLAAHTDEEISSGNFGGGPSKPQPKSSSPAEVIPGVSVQDLTPGNRQRYDIPADASGIVVITVKPNSVAASSGLQEGDVIYNINLKPVKSLAEATTAAKVMGDEKSIVLRISRAGEKKPAIVLDFEQ